MKTNNENNGDSDHGYENSQVYKNKISRKNTEMVEELIHTKQDKSTNDHILSRLFFGIGLCMSLLFIITAFEWKFYDKGNNLSLGSLSSEFNDIIDVPPTEQPPPPPPKIEQPKIIEVSDEQEIKETIPIVLDIEMKEEQVIEQKIFEDVNMDDIEDEKADEIFTVVEEQPSPKGGIKAFYEYVAKNLSYPSAARRMNIEGRVYIAFIVEKNGSLTDVKSIKGIGGGCDEEAVRIIEGAPKWNPGKQRGRPVRVKMVLPVLFQLQ